MHKKHLKTDQIRSESLMKINSLLFLLLINISGIIVADDEIIKIMPIKANLNYCEPMLSEGNLVPLERIPPRYPGAALKKLTEGYVSMELYVDEAGSVMRIEIIESKPDKIFNKAALDAVKQWKFRTPCGLPVNQKGTIRIEFKL